jgi:hypothetical protein
MEGTSKLEGASGRGRDWTGQRAGNDQAELTDPGASRKSPNSWRPSRKSKWTEIPAIMGSLGAQTDNIKGIQAASDGI